MSLKSIFGPVTSERVAEALNAGMNPKSLRARLMLLNTNGARILGLSLALIFGGSYLIYLWVHLFIVIVGLFIGFFLGLPTLLRRLFKITWGETGVFSWLTPLSARQSLCRDYVDGIRALGRVPVEGAPTEPVYAVNRVLYVVDLANVLRVGEAQERVRKKRMAQVRRESKRMRAEREERLNRAACAEAHTFVKTQ